MPVPEGASEFSTPGGIQMGQIGNPITIPTSGIIAPTHRIHHILEGAGLISTITPPWPDFVGPLILLTDIASSNWTWDALGNIAWGLSPATVERGICYCFYYDRQIDKWYPCTTAAYLPS